MENKEIPENADFVKFTLREVLESGKSVDEIMEEKAKQGEVYRRDADGKPVRKAKDEDKSVVTEFKPKKTAIADYIKNNLPATTNIPEFTKEIAEMDLADCLSWFNLNPSQKARKIANLNFLAQLLGSEEMGGVSSHFASYAQQQQNAVASITFGWFTYTATPIFGKQKSPNSLLVTHGLMKNFGVPELHFPLAKKVKQPTPGFFEEVVKMWIEICQTDEDENLDNDFRIENIRFVKQKITVKPDIYDPFPEREGYRVICSADGTGLTLDDCRDEHLWQFSPFYGITDSEVTL